MFLTTIITLFFFEGIELTDSGTGIVGHFPSSPACKLCARIRQFVAIFFEIAHASPCHLEFAFQRKFSSIFVPIPSPLLSWHVSRNRPDPKTDRHSLVAQHSARRQFRFGSATAADHYLGKISCLVNILNVRIHSNVRAVCIKKFWFNKTTEDDRVLVVRIEFDGRRTRAWMLQSTSEAIDPPNLSLSSLCPITVIISLPKVTPYLER